MDQYEEEVLGRIESGENFYNDELKDISNIFEVDRWYGDTIKNGERFTVINVVVKLNNRFFVIKYGYNFSKFNNIYWEQPVEVEKKKVEKIIVVNEWIPKK